MKLCCKSCAGIQESPSQGKAMPTVLKDIFNSGYYKFYLNESFINTIKSDLYIKALEKLKKQGLRFGFEDDRQYPVIFMAVREDNLNALKCLKIINYDMNRTSQNGETALMSAAAGGKNEVIKLLLKLGASLTQNDNFGRNALFFAAEQGHLKTVKLLLNLGLRNRGTTYGTGAIAYMEEYGVADEETMAAIKKEILRRG